MKIRKRLVWTKVGLHGLSGILLVLLGSALNAEETSMRETVYELWENEPAPNRGADDAKIQAGGYPYDKDWEYYSYPIGNGYIGANLFGRTDTERVQITDKTVQLSRTNQGSERGGKSVP
jgi:hypothetical protein